MRNKHGGSCYHCGQWVQPGAGYFERHNGKFRVQHIECCEKARKDLAFAVHCVNTHDKLVSALKGAEALILNMLLKYEEDNWVPEVITERYNKLPTVKAIKEALALAEGGAS